ncbi:hypothetical protein D8B26_002855 [Coccidioides posadasii str. Silveira]|uniref:uncharacterized protein n=1 Tax=Coccidioides posadasii (strain RMSCC 757 / Silveira) TaxID=443226 RepID=UPI001BEE5A75|nr:hypothetical protein D8B26_002855 [Coccidioides posadasii str. Silveira]
MDSSSSAFSRLSLGDILTPQTTRPMDKSLAGDTDIFQIDRFISETFDSGLLILDENEFEKGEFLGSGRSMSTYKGKWKSRSRPVALKYINLSPPVGTSSAAARGTELQSILRSAALELRVLQHETTRIHPNIVEILAVSWQQITTLTGQCEIYPILIMELACPDYPTLGELAKKEFHNLSLTIRLSLLRDVFEGIAVLHELDIVHGDLKPDNVLIFRDASGNLTAKISDFGFSQVELPTGSPSFGAGGTEYWNAPECLRDAPDPLAIFRKEKSRDFYSYALLAVSIFLGEPPFDKQGWNLAEISRMKLQDEISGQFASRWRFIESRFKQDPTQWRNLSGPLLWKVLRKDGWSPEEDLPLSLLRLIPKMLQLEPSKRPTTHEIRSAFRLCTGDRVIKPKVNRVKNDKHVIFAGGAASVMGNRSTRAHSLCNPAIPHNLRFALFKSFLVSARDQNQARRTNAMVNIGYCMINAFGTRFDLPEAIVWFGRAGMEGDTTGQEMVFRLERVLKKSATELVLGLNNSTRVNWMVTCLLRDLGAPQLPNILPPEIHLERPQDKLKDILLGFEPELVESGLRRAVDDAIIKTLALQSKDYSEDPAWKSFPGLWDAVVRDDPAAVSELLDVNDPRWTPNVRETFILTALEQRAMNVLRSLVYEHKFYIDKVFEIALGRAFLKSDTEMIALLLALEVPWDIMFSSNSLNSVLTGCTVTTITVALRLFSYLKVDDSTEYSPYWDEGVLRREIMDGIQPGMCSLPSDVGTVDNYAPPIFETIVYNRPLNLWLILSLGGNPNVRYMGMTALHFAVKMLRPLLVAMLLAFDADPNTRDTRHEYETPLHQISRQHMRPLNTPRDTYFQALDVFGDKFVPAPEYPDEDNNHRRLIIRLLVEYGADLNALCAEGMTPLTKAVLSQLPHAPIIAKYLIELGADSSIAGASGFSSLHAASTKGSLQLLRYILYLPGRSMLNLRSKNGTTPLMAASTDDDRARHLIELLEAGADIGLRNNSGHNALSIAMKHSRKIIFDILITHITQVPPRLREAVFVNAVSGITAAHDAFASKDQEMIPHFLRRMIPIMTHFHRPNKSGLTPLHLAVLKKHTAALRLLLDNGANVDAKTDKGMNPLDLARGLRERTFVNILLRWKGESQMRNEPPLAPEQFQSLSAASAQYADEVASMHGEGNGSTSQSAETDLQAARYKQKLMNDSQYIPNDRFTRDTADPSKGITKIEEVHSKMLEISVSRKGEQDYTSLWRMNNLGCVYERFGRLFNAETIYRKGWNISLEVLGNNHILTADFANKLVRVLEDLGRPEDPVLTEWISWYGKDTLEPPLFQLRFQPGNAYSSSTSSTRPEVEETCARLECNNSSRLTCQKCLVYRFCSESCRSLEWEDKTSSHSRECIHSLTSEETPAIVSQKLVPEDPYAQKLTSFIYSRIMAGFIESDFGERPPTVYSAHLILYDPKAFHTPVRFRTKKNTAVMFLSNGGFQYLFKATDSQWKTPRRADMMLLYTEVDFWVSPPRESMPQQSPAAAAAADGTTANTEMLLLVDYIYLDFPKAQERRQQRLSSVNTDIRVIQCDYAGQKQKMTN